MATAAAPAAALATALAVAESAVEKSDPQTLIKWGLGRGVNIIKKTPWLEKTPFQVRAVVPKSVIETDDGGLLKAYTEEVRSKMAVNTEVQAGIRPTNVPLNVRMDVEYTRSTLSAKYVVGKKIKNRTISFRADFADVATSLAKDMEEAKKLLERGPTEQRTSRIISRSASYPPLHDEKITRRHFDTRSSLPHAISSAAFTSQFLSRVEGGSPSVIPGDSRSFEECLMSWVMTCLQHKGYTCQSNFEDTMYHLLNDDEKEKTKVYEHIKESLDHFVEKFGVTHYVSSIEVGALEYQELSQKQFVNHAKVSAEASVTVASYGAASAKTTQRFMKAVNHKRSETKKIGEMEDDKVTNEAVIGCSFHPISGLIKMPYLQRALKESIDDYVLKSSKDGGPYHIVFGDDLNPPKFITVDHENGRKLIGTEKIEEAEGFMVKTIEDEKSKNHLEFSLTSSFPSYRAKKKLATGALQYYLVTTVNLIGKGDAPVMQMDSKAKNVRLKLKQRINSSISCHTKQWRKEREAYYIRCVHSPRSGYLCVRKRADEDKYEVCIKPTINHHSQDDSEMFMLFRLKKTDSRTNSKADSKAGSKTDSKDDPETGSKDDPETGSKDNSETDSKDNSETESEN